MSALHAESFDSPEIVVKSRHAPVINPSPLTQRNRPTLANQSPVSPTSSTTGATTREMSTHAGEIPSQMAQEIVLSDEQNKVLEIIKQGHNIFYTGSAGTGKSVLLRHAIKMLRELHNPGEVAVTASTGLAACNIGGITLHSFSGIGLGEGKVQQLIKKIKRSKKSSNNWQRTKVLIVDEVSMVDGTLLDKLNAIAKNIRKNDQPFGGIQVIFCGDFYQLPPVVKRNFGTNNNNNLHSDINNADSLFAFQCQSWKESVKIQVILTKIFRQQGDLEFIDMLNEMRNGKLSERTIKNFIELRRALPINDGIEPAELFSTRNEVDRANIRRLKQLKDPEFVFNAIDGGSLIDKDARDKMLSNFLAPQQLILKKGAQVMMIKNLDDTLVNGTLGKVIDFVDPDTYCFYQKMQEGDTKNIEEAITKKLEKQAEAKNLYNYKAANNNSNKQLLEINSQDEPTKFPSSLDESVFDFFKLINEDDSIDPIQKDNMARKQQLINTLYSASKQKRYPLVRFLMNDGTTRDVLMCPETWDIEDEYETPLVSRTQIPLMLAWAISIHKSQGQTLTKAKVDLRRVFEKGQAYVALSRVTSRQGLQVLNFIPSKVMTHLSVTDFYQSLVSADGALAKANEISSHPSFIAKQFFTMQPPTLKETSKKGRGRKNGSAASGKAGGEEKKTRGRKRGTKKKNFGPGPGPLEGPDLIMLDDMKRAFAREDY